MVKHLEQEVKTWHVKHWLVECNNPACNWTTTLHPDDQTFNPELAHELNKQKCAYCGCTVKVSWHDQAT